MTGGWLLREGVEPPNLPPQIQPWMSSFLCCRGLTTWNSLPRHLRDPVHITTIFGRLLKTLFFSEYYIVAYKHIRGCFGVDELY